MVVGFAWKIRCTRISVGEKRGRYCQTLRVERLEYTQFDPYRNSALSVLISPIDRLEQQGSGFVCISSRSKCEKGGSKRIRSKQVDYPDTLFRSIAHRPVESTGYPSENLLSEHKVESRNAMKKKCCTHHRTDATSVMYKPKNCRTFLSAPYHSYALCHFCPCIPPSRNREQCGNH